MTTDEEAAVDAEIEQWLVWTSEMRIPEEERQKRCATCWRGLSRCSCPAGTPTVAELLRDLEEPL